METAHCTGAPVAGLMQSTPLGPRALAPFQSLFLLSLLLAFALRLPLARMPVVAPLLVVFRPGLGRNPFPWSLARSPWAVGQGFRQFFLLFHVPFQIFVRRSYFSHGGRRSGPNPHATWQFSLRGKERALPVFRVLVWTLAWGWLWREAHPLAGPSMVAPVRAPAGFCFPSLVPLPTPFQVDRLFSLLWG